MSSSRAKALESEINGLVDWLEVRDHPKIESAFRERIPKVTLAARRCLDEQLEFYDCLEEAKEKGESVEYGKC